MHVLDCNAIGKVTYLPSVAGARDQATEPTAWGGTSRVIVAMRELWDFSQNTAPLPCNPAIPILGIYPEKP